MLDRVGTVVLASLAWVGEVSFFAVHALRAAVVPPYEAREIARQIAAVGLRSTPLIVAAGLALGVVLSMHTRATLERFGAEAMIPAGLALALIRETGPLTTALLVSGRAGAGIGAELGAMRVTGQIDALEAVGVDAVRFLAATRIVACILALPLLTTIMNVCGILGGGLAEAVTTGMPWQVYLQRAFSAVELRDLLPATAKTAVFGLIIGTLACHYGFTTTRDSEGVGRASTHSVVVASMLIILANVVLVRLIVFLLPARV